MLTALQLVKLAILETVARWDGVELVAGMTADRIDEKYDELVYLEEDQDARNDVRCGEFETGLPAGYSRNYESKSVAIKIAGKYVGWTYWFGGGKHASPEEVDWMEDVYFLDCVEEEKVVTVRTFTKVDA